MHEDIAMIFQKLKSTSMIEVYILLLRLNLSI